MKLALQLVTWNGAAYMPYLLDSLKRQTRRDWELFVLDNGSSADEWRKTEAAVKASGLPATLVRLEANSGFAPGHDRLFTKHDAEYVQLLNQDAFLEPEFLEKLTAHLDAHPDCAAVSGAIFRWDFDRRAEMGSGRTTIADSLGIARTWFGTYRDIDAGLDIGPLPKDAPPLAVLGVSGCLPMYRRSALVETSLRRTIFDPTFFSYKEDVDLALRLQAAGWTAATVPTATAYHRRSLGVAAKVPVTSESRYLSFRNHLWIIAAHWRPRDLLLLPGQIVYEKAKVWYWLKNRPENVRRAWRETRAAWPRLMRKRAFIRELRRTVRPVERLKAPLPEADLAVVSVSYNGLDDRYLESLAEAIKTSSHRILPVIVNNAADKYRAEELAWAKLPGAIVILRDRNHGFGRSSNRGAREVSARYYMMLNPDTAISDPTVFDRLCDWLDAHPNCGLAAPRLVGEDGELSETCRRYPRWYTPLTQRTSIGHTEWGRNYSDRFLMRDYDHKTPREVDWAQGSAMCLPARVWRQLGGFDDRFWLYYEDIDLCRRVRVLGYDLTYLPELTIMHAYGRASAKIRNHLLNFLKNRATRGHILSCILYHLKWRWQPEPSADV